MSVDPDFLTYDELERDLNAQVALCEAMARATRKHHVGYYEAEVAELEAACNRVSQTLASARNALTASASVPDDASFTVAITKSANAMADAQRRLKACMNADGVWGLG